MVYGMTVHFQFLYAPGVDQGLEFLPNGFYQDHQTGYLNSAAGTPCAGPYEHEQQQDRTGISGHRLKSVVA